MTIRPCAYAHRKPKTDEEKPRADATEHRRRSKNYLVWCPVCGATGPVKETARKAIFAWNHRNEEA